MNDLSATAVPADPPPSHPSAAGGDVTYLFSDVEGSTRLWETMPERIGPALARHDRLAREIVERHGGRVVKMTGDGLHAAFDRPAAALAAVVEIQFAFALPGESEVLPLALRCGLHLGADQQRDGDFFGPAVNRAARIMQAAHGGQVLLSQAVAERARDALPAQVSLRDLGKARLRDLAAPETLYQLVHPGLRSDFPALRSLASTPNNLPQQVNSFVGRARELDEVRAMLSYPTVRLLTLLGMGGLGKSRLSLQAAAEVLDDYPDGVWFVELAALSDPRSVPQAVAGVLGIKEEAGSDVQDALLRHCRDRAMLIVLDNCEHVVQACAEFARRVLQSAPQVKVLASSRDALQIAGETVIHVPPLAAPDAGATITPTALAQIDAVRLFIDRATAAQPAFRVTERNAAAVAAICRRLDGIPLALELAAARTRALSVEAIAARLDDRFKLLVTGDRTVLPRQRTLRALIDWSYDLLSSAERQLFARLSVFAGGWTLEAAEAVGAGGEIDTADVLDVLANLVQKSLVSMSAEAERYQMLDTVRQYAAERLAELGEASAVRERHLRFHLTLAEQARPQLAGPEQGRWLARLDAERENLLAAHRCCDTAEGGAARGLQLVFLLKLYWFHRGLLALGHELVSEALARTAPGARTLERSRGLCDLGQICAFMGRHQEARGYLEESVSIATELGDEARTAAALQPLVYACRGGGDLKAAASHAHRALELARRVGNPRQTAAALTSLAQVLRLQDDLVPARAMYEEAVAIARELGDKESIAIGLLNLSLVALARAEGEQARPLLAEVVALTAETGSQMAGQAALDVTAATCALLGAPGTCARFSGAADAQAQRSALSRDAVDARVLLPLIESARRALGEDDFVRAHADGAALELAAALAEAQRWLMRG